MLLEKLKNKLKTFRDKKDGTISVEAVIVLPMLFWAVAATYEYFEAFRYISAREKATYTVADALSREQAVVTEIYIDNMKSLFDIMTNDDGETQIRISVIQYHQNGDEYSVRWSKVRGDGSWSELEDDDVAKSHETLPLLDDAEEIILVESTSFYQPTFLVGLDSNLPMATRIFTDIRFASQLCFEGSFCDDLELANL